MNKIPTIFERGADFKVIDKPRAECAWVFNGEGVATEKLDGTNVRLTVRNGSVVRVEKRRNPSKAQKTQGIIDGWYVDALEDAAEDRWIFAAVRGTNVTGFPDGEHSAEALGPSIQSNPLWLEKHMCIAFGLPRDFRPEKTTILGLFVPAYDVCPRDYAGLKQWLATADSLFSPGHLAEGVVFHHQDGRMAKIKRKDFGA